MARTKIGIIGCGNISGAYLSVLKRFPSVEVSAVSDVDLERAKKRAEEYGVPKACSVNELLADPGIQIVINLTIPAAHAEIALKALEAGKHTQCEKPFAVTRADGQKVLAAAKAKNLRVGCAPDTFLGAGYQTCRKLIDDGAIGTPIGATAFMTCRGHERWHPDPEFFYKAGGGPMFDMGPYYLTALVFLLGPVKRVTGSARITFPERTITSQPKAGQKIKVDIPTHVTGVAEFHNGAAATIIQSFDVWRANLPILEIYGTDGTLACPDPNGFGGQVRLFKQNPDPAKPSEWQDVPLTHGHPDQSRGIGVVDMAFAIKENRPHRTSGELAYHVLDVMHAFHDSSREAKWVDLASTCERPAPLPVSSLSI